MARLVGQPHGVAHQVVLHRHHTAQRIGDLGEAVGAVVGHGRHRPTGVGDGDGPPHGIVLNLRDLIHGVGDRRDVASGVIGEGRGSPLLVGDAVQHALPARLCAVAQRHRLSQRIGDLREVTPAVGERGGTAQRVGDARGAAPAVIDERRRLVQGIRDGERQATARVGHACHPSQTVHDLAGLPGGGVPAILRRGPSRVGHAAQQAVATKEVDGTRPGLIGYRPLEQNRRQPRPNQQPLRVGHLCVAEGELLAHAVLLPDHVPLTVKGVGELHLAARVGLGCQQRGNALVAVGYRLPIGVSHRTEATRCHMGRLVVAKMNRASTVIADNDQPIGLVIVVAEPQIATTGCVNTGQPCPAVLSHANSGLAVGFVSHPEHPAVRILLRDQSALGIEQVNALRAVEQSPATFGAFHQGHLNPSRPGVDRPTSVAEDDQIAAGGRQDGQIVARRDTLLKGVDPAWPQSSSIKSALLIGAREAQCHLRAARGDAQVLLLLELEPGEDINRVPSSG
ncbi:hypothetical protein OSCT_3045 [Oscillochloris trichoides DG-6]|uniref:Uncharacterized protein n=1 Tax=Oscillochloris trichoides DG-6 TaxID=765420 RepID=E1II95_9CHLR|nr:hypothetical protein OSCT_3045 [Oscillochloris trichoides DG-6]